MFSWLFKWKNLIQFNSPFRLPRKDWICPTQDVMLLFFSVHMNNHSKVAISPTRILDLCLHATCKQFECIWVHLKYQVIIKHWGFLGWSDWNRIKSLWEVDLISDLLSNVIRGFWVFTVTVEFCNIRRMTTQRCTNPTSHRWNIWIPFKIYFTSLLICHKHECAIMHLTS